MLCLTATIGGKENKKGHNGVSWYVVKIRLSKQKKPLNTNTPLNDVKPRGSQSSNNGGSLRGFNQLLVEYFCITKIFVTE